ncbi:FecR domain-containing protein [Chitinilyticum piscinae]|uniref:FecR domain-containing protein n=1 Tax=Chitinilyticum piscinae TaxID=2866724 RepID=A0A8J7K9J7_9NEIS|nr:FecR domain-containing protein [Chitinilyticum piscinae]MBE9608239.1 FecR domain-containing protein [Chitinilyticum piscinae]
MSKPYTRRQILQWLAGSTLLLGGRAIAGAFFLPKPGLKSIKGQVLINGKPAVVGQPVSWGDEVVTGSNSEAVFTVDGDAYLLRANTEVTLGLAAAEHVVKVQSGKMLAVFGPGEKTIRTQAVTLGIRGTGLYVESHGARSYVCLCYGSVELTPTADPAARMTYQTKHHEHPYWVEGKQIKAASEVINHTDAELTMLEALQYRRPPFANGLNSSGGGGGY